MFGSQQILTRMATLVTVGDVCGPILTTFDVETKIPDAAGIWQDACLDRIPSDPLAYVSLVSKQNKVVGWLDFSDLVVEPNRSDAVDACMVTINVNSLVTAETPLLEAMKLFDSHSPYCFLVMKGNAIIGAFSYQDLLSIPFRSCLFAMLLSIEQAILDIVQTAPALAVSKLKDRGRRVEKQINKRRLPGSRSILPSEILERSYFSEVLNVLNSCSKTKNRLTALNATYTKQRRIYRLKAGAAAAVVKQEKKLRVDQAVELRNALAHPKEPWRVSQLLPKEDLNAFISWLTEFEGQLTEYLALGNILKN
jgi:hypothetical protein